MAYKQLTYVREVQVGSKTIPMVTPDGSVTVNSRKTKPLPWQDAIPTAKGIFTLTGAGPNVSLSTDGRVATVKDESCVFGSIGKSSGKWYFEFEATTIGIVSGQPSGPVIGLALDGAPSVAPFVNGGTVFAVYTSGTSPMFVYGDNTPIVNYGLQIHEKDLVGCALDLTAGTFQFFVNGADSGGQHSIADYITTYVPGSTNLRPFTSSQMPWDPPIEVVTYMEQQKYTPAGFEAW